MAIKFLNNIDVSGEVEGTSLDINGNADIAGNLVIQSGGPSLTIKDTTDDDDQQILFMNSSGTVDYRIHTSDFTSGGGGDGLYIGSTQSDGEVCLVTHDTIALTLDTSQNAIFAGGVSIGGHTMNDIDVASEVTNADDHLMSALAIKNKIEDYGYITSSGNTSGNAATATQLATSRSIGGVSFNGTSAINLPGVNTAGNQNTSGTAAIATAITVADESSDTSCSVLFTTSAAGNLNAKSGSNLTFNSATGLLTATKFNGALTGNVTGNVSGTAGGAAKGLSHLDTETSITGHGVIVGNTDGTGITQVTGNATSANKFLRSRGSANAVAAPTFESLTYSDLTGTVPTFNQNTSGTAAGLTGLTGSRVMVSAGNGTSSVSAITTTELNYLNDVTSNIQTQLDAKQASLTFGIGNTNSLRANASLADNDFLKVDGTSIEGRTAAQVVSDLGIEAGATADQTQSDINGLGITQVGTITSGEWNGTAINQTYLTGQSGTNTGDVCSSDHANAGYVTSSGITAVNDSNANTFFPLVFHDESNGLLDDTSGLTYNPSLGSMHIPEYIVHQGDGDTYIRFADNSITIMMGDTNYTTRWNSAYDAINSGGILASFGSDFSNHDSGLDLVTDDFSGNLGTYSGNSSVAYDRTTLQFHGDFLRIKNDHGGANKDVMLFDLNGRIGLNQSAPLFGVHDSRASGANSDHYLVNGSMGLGTTPRAADSYIDVVGDVFTGVSDRRFKTDIRPYKNPIEKVKSLNGFTYKYNDLAKSIAPKTYGHDNDMAGVFAQEVQAVVPEAVLIAPCDSDEYGNSISGENYLTVNYEKLVPLLIEAVKEQQKQIEELKEKIDGNPS